MDVAPCNWDFSCDFEINFGSSENASIAYSVLAVDKELQPDKVRREMSVSDDKIFVYVSISLFPLSLSPTTHHLSCTKHIMLSINCNKIYANYIWPWKYNTSEGCE